jgi:hypothetical protein
MDSVINLRRERKRARRLQAEHQAAAKRAAYGRSKAEQNLTQSQSDKERSKFDQHRIETGEQHEIAGR